MIIDFHTHIFPDKIASKAVGLLSQNGGIPPFSDGTVKGLVDKLKRAQASVGIALPVLTSPAQFDSVNRFAKEVNDAFSDKETKIISFGGIHPRCEDIEGKMKLIKESGFLGVKLHPDYQGAFINDEGYIKILECAKEYDLIVVTHSGVDGAFPNESVRCTPALAKEVIRRVRHDKFVLAHYGANEMSKEVLSTLCGENVYFDTAYMLRFIDEGDFKEILKRHGEDKILFASDSPWSDISSDVQIIKSFFLGKEAEERIFYKNAKTLLNL